MDKYTLKVNDYNIRKTFEEDALGRNEYVLGLVKWINQVDKNAVFSLEGDWGSGKTFLLKQLELLYNKNDLINNLKNKPKDVNLSDFKPDNVKLFYYDAWENDGAENPLLNLVFNLATKAEILTSNINVEPNTKEIAKFVWDKAKKLNPALEVVDFISKYIKIEKKDIFENITKENVVRDALKEFINEIKKKYDNKKIVIIIDELDRCRPEFALKIIESIKHYFDEEGIVVILSINPTEMESIIIKYYGDRIDATAYLDKIIDVHLQVPKLKTKDYIKYALGRINDNALVYYAMMTIINKYQLNMRQINRYLGTLKAVLGDDVLSGLRVPSGIYAENSIYDLIKVYLPVYLIGINIYNKEKYNSLVNGSKEGKEIFLNDFLSVPENIVYFKIRHFIKCDNDGFEINDDIVSKSREWLSDFYDKYFVNVNAKDDESYQNAENRKLLFNTLNLLCFNEKYYY